MYYIGIANQSALKTLATQLTIAIKRVAVIKQT